MFIDGVYTNISVSTFLSTKYFAGKFAMKDLVYKLPGGTDNNIRLSDLTTIAILNTIRILVEKSAVNVRNLRDAGGIEKITTINNARSVSTSKLV